MMSTAPASRGNPKWNASSTARKISVSSISSAAGTMPAPMMSLMVLVASSMVSNTPKSVRYASGFFVSRTHTFDTTPNVPSEPTIVPVRS